MSSYLEDKAGYSEAKRLCWKRSGALDRVGGDESLLDELVALFLIESPKLVTQMQQALLRQDQRVLEVAAHTLKGQLAFLELPQTSEAQMLEDAGRSGELKDAEDILVGLQMQLEEVWSLLAGKAGA